MGETAQIDLSVLINKPLERAIKLSKDVVDVESRTAKSVAITSDEPILHWVGGRGYAYVILDHSPKSINFERLKASAPFLENHDYRLRLGRLRHSASDGHVLRTDIRFNSRPYTDEVFAEINEDLANGDSPGVSTGFEITYIEDKIENYIDGIPVVRATKWTPYEASLATMERDLRCGFGRCIGEEWGTGRPSSIQSTKPTNEGPEAADPPTTPEVRTNTMPDPIAPPVTPPPPAQSPLVMLEQRTTDYVKFAVIYGNTDEQKAALTEMAREHALAGKSEDELKATIIDTRKQWQTKVPVAMPQLNEAEKKKYSISRAILADASMRDRELRGDTQCFELDVSQEIEKRIADSVPGYKPHGGFYMPTGLALRGLQPIDQAERSDFYRFMQRFMTIMTQRADLLTRAGLDTATDTKGQELVFTEPGSFIDLLRKKAMVINLGATVLPGLQGNVAFPKQIGAGSFTWVGENSGADVADSNLTLDQVTLSPKTGMSSTSYSRQLLRQSVVDIDGLVMTDLVKINALGLDVAALHGSGVAPIPRGIYNTSGIGSVAFGGAITFAKVVDMETAVAVADADIGTMAYLTTPNVRGTAKKTLEAAAAGSKMIWQNGEMNGYRAEATNQISKTLGGGGAEHGIVLGVWEALLIGEWGALEIITDPYSLKKQGMIELTSFMMADIAARYAEAFCKGTGLTP